MINGARRCVVQRRIATAMQRALQTHLKAHPPTDPTSYHTKLQHVLTDLLAVSQKSKWWSVETDIEPTPISYLLSRLDNHQNTGGNVISQVLGAVRARSPLTRLAQAFTIFQSYTLPLTTDPLTGLNAMNAARKRILAHGPPSDSVDWNSVGLTLDPETGNFTILSEPALIFYFVEQFRVRAYNPSYSSITEHLTPDVLSEVYAGTFTIASLTRLLEQMSEAQVPTTPTGSAVTFPYPDPLDLGPGTTTTPHPPPPALQQNAFFTGRKFHRGTGTGSVTIAHPTTSTGGTGGTSSTGGTAAAGGAAQLQQTRGRSKSRDPTRIPNTKGEDIYAHAVELAGKMFEQVPALAKNFNDYMKQHHQVENFFAVNDRGAVIFPLRCQGWALKPTVRKDFFILFQFFTDINRHNTPGFALSAVGQKFRLTHSSWAGALRDAANELLKKRPTHTPPLPTPRTILVADASVLAFSS
jgi:hypothetical protein